MTTPSKPPMPPGHCCAANLLFLFFALLFPFSGTGTPTTKKNTTLILKSANSNENSFMGGELISILRGNVVFLYGDITIRSDEATWWRNEGRVSFSNNITITKGPQTLTCDRMQFTRATNAINASGNFFFRDTAEMTEMRGRTAIYRVDTKDFSLSGAPRLVRYDPAAAETLIISGVTMTYTDSLKKAVVTDSVVITKGKLFSRCHRAVYFTDDNIALLRGAPRITWDIHTITGDSVNLGFGKESLKNAAIFGNAHGIYIDTVAGKRDSAFTKVWGDSLFMSIAESGHLDSLWVHGKALTRYFTASKPDIVNQANGRVMLMSFESGGEVDQLKIWGNARSTYYIEESDGRGVNEASGDSITVSFLRGKATFLNLAGSARGLFFPSDL